MKNQKWIDVYFILDYNHGIIINLSNLSNYAKGGINVSYYGVR